MILGLRLQKGRSYRSLCCLFCHAPLKLLEGYVVINHCVQIRVEDLTAGENPRETGRGRGERERERERQFFDKSAKQMTQGMR